MIKATATPIWIEFNVDRAENQVRLSARGSRGEQLPARPMSMDLDALLRFASSVQQAAARGKAFSPTLVSEARAIQQAVLDGETSVLFARLKEAAAGPLLMRFLVHDSELQGLPWEASCNAGEALGFWATSPNVLPVRGVMSSAPWQSREVRGAVRVLAIAPTGSASLTNLRAALEERISSGEIEWLEPIEAAGAKLPGIFDRLRRDPVPHVIHFLGHGGLEKGLPVLRMADDDEGEETWLEVEVLAQQLAANFHGMLRLIVLEACEGARPSAFASAAEIFARAGADAVVAFLWPVRADVARTCSTEFYRAMSGSDRAAGDIAVAMNEARRAMLGAYDASAEAMSPVVYLRGPDGKIFDFKGRKIASPKPGVVRAAALSTPTSSEVPSSFARILRAPFSLVLGDRWQDDGAALEKFRGKLQTELAKATDADATGLPISTLAQWFALHRGPDKLGSEFQKAFRADMDPPPMIAALAQRVCPGVHTTMLRSPWLEQSIAEKQPDRTIYVIQPDDDGALVLKREGGAEDWEEMDAPPVELDIDQEILILRPYRGYTPEQVFTRPLLTDDDYYLRLRDLWNTSVLPVDLANAILRTLGRRPALMLGLSMHTANHRMLLHNLYPHGIPRESFGVVDATDREGKLWQSGAGLPGKNEGVEVFETNGESLCTALETIAQEAGQ